MAEGLTMTLPDDWRAYIPEIDDDKPIDERFRLYKLRKGYEKVLIDKYLKNPELLELIDKELNKKVVKENEARKVIFLIANMRNVENLNKGSDNLIVNALSGTGKDHVVGAVFDLIPSDEKEELIRTTPKVLAYTRNRKVGEAKK